MSKFDTLFNKPRPNNNASFNSVKSNSNSFVSKGAGTKAIYDYKEEAFPDLVSSNKTLVNTSVVVTKKYSDITATVAEVKKAQEENPVPPGWTGFTRSKGNWKFDIVHGEKTKRQLEMDQEDALLNNPAYIYNQLITTLSKNWLRYKTQYDSIHGEGAYDLIYYLEPVYPEDEYLSDGSSNNNNSNNEYVNKFSYDAETEAE